MQTLYDGDTFTHRGASFRVTFPQDDHNEAPWSRDDGHGVVSDWDSDWGDRAKEPHERVLSQHGRWAYYYDVKASIRKALAEGWDAEPYHAAFPNETKRQQAVRAVEADYQFLRGWATEEWVYVGVVVKRIDRPGRASVWGIESNAGAYLAETARELADEILGTEAPDLRASVVAAGAGL